MSMSLLQEIAGSDRAWAAERAAMAIAITEQYQGGGLDKGEYDALMLDLVRLDTLEAEADDIQLKAQLISAVYALSKLA